MKSAHETELESLRRELESCRLELAKAVRYVYQSTEWLPWIRDIKINHLAMARRPERVS